MLKQSVSFLLELLLWFAAPAIFLGIYVVRFRHSPVVIVEHLYPVALLGALAFLVRLCLTRLLPSRALALALAATFHVTLLLALIAYYFVVVTGLSSWGKVISKQLITAYAGQAAGLAEAIGWSLPLVLALLALVWLLAVGLYYGFSRRLDWSAPGPGNGQARHLTTALLLCAALLVLHRLDAALAEARPGSSEPFALTLFGSAARPGFADPSVVHHAEYDRQESAARQQYRPAEPAARRKNVILIVADALRGDHLQAYGYPRPTSPFLEQAVKQGMLQKIDNVHAPCAESNCAMASLLSSREPSRYPSDAFTLSQVLDLHGYATIMILGGDQTNYYNKRAIYGKVDDYYDGSMASDFYANDDSLVLAKTRQLPRWAGQPTMLQFHLMSTHLLGKKLGAYRVFTPSTTFVRVPRSPPRPDYTNHYDNGVRQFDDMVRQLLETLREKKYLDSAIVVITSDHGEGLGERGLLSHGNGVHEPLLHVPLLVSGLQVLPATADQPFISLRDIAPSILDELGLPIPASWRGVSIAALQRAGRNAELQSFEMGDFAGVFDGRRAGPRWKYAINRRTKEESVYDLSSDPLEMTNLLWRAPPDLLGEWRRSVVSDLPR